MDSTFSKALQRVIKKRLRRGVHSDLTIVVEDNSEFQVHKILLAASSPYFETLFKYYPKEPKLYLSLVKRESMEAIIGIIYGEQPMIPEDQVFQLLIDADYLDCSKIVEHYRGSS